MNNPLKGFLALSVVVLLICGQARAASCTESVDTRLPALSNGFAFNPSNTRNNASRIDSTNVAKLQQGPSHATPNILEKRGAPAVTQETVFYTAGRSIFAANRASGCQYWSYSIPNKTSLLGPNALRSSSVYYLKENGRKPALVIVGDYYANVYAINAQSGELAWSQLAGVDDVNYMITGGMQAYGAKLFVPVATKEVITAVVESSTNCCKTHGLLRALDIYSGRILWTYQTAPDATLNRFSGRYAPNGMSIWGTPAIDPGRHSVYIGTAQNLTPPATSNSDSIIALDIDTGTPKWIFQGRSGDAWNISCTVPIKALQTNCVWPEGWDYDFGAPPILVHMASGNDAVIAGEKSGVLFSIDPDTGAKNWSRRLGAGGDLGGIHWGMAVDGTRVYAGVADLSADKITAAQALSPVPQLKLFATPDISPSPRARPGVYAVDLLTGKLVWEQHPTHPYDDPQQGVRAVNSIFSAAVSVTNDVVFAGSLDGVLHAFRSSDGAELWSYDTTRSFTDVDGNAGHGGRIDSVGAVPVGDDLLINSGYATFGGPNAFQAGNGNALLVLRLPEH